ncbi:MAG: glucosaminidase domain-containing protein, partial [Myxococcota bacterium]|nr:glucosaminidase domain-containing protein [Myxococcota bacterium]
MRSHAGIERGMAALLGCGLGMLVWAWAAHGAPPISGKQTGLVPEASEARQLPGLSASARASAVQLDDLDVEALWAWMSRGREGGGRDLNEVFQQIRDLQHNEHVASLLVQAQASDWPPDHRGAFLARLAPMALVSARVHRVPPSVTMAQAILESGWGRSKLARDHGNLFGIKSGATTGGVVMNTIEGVDQREAARFRSYGDWQASLEHHDALLATDQRYRQARPDWVNWRRYLERMAPVYATDPAYRGKLGELIVAYRLDRWDELVV